MWNFNIFRQLVPLVAREELTYLNSGFQLSSNVSFMLQSMRSPHSLCFALIKCLVGKEMLRRSGN